MVTNSTNTERLTPLDLLIPKVYAATTLTFSTTQPASAVLPALQDGLDRLHAQLPWLSGRVHPVSPTSESGPSLEIRWDAGERPPVLADKGSISAPYESLSAQGMPPESIPQDVWPAPALIDEELFSGGAPVFAASLFRFGDNKGFGLCVCLHHNVADATGYAELLKLWTRALGPEPPLSDPASQFGRFARLGAALRPHLDAASAVSSDGLYASHPEYSKEPPAMPSPFPPSTTALFAIPIARIDAVKEMLGPHMQAAAAAAAAGSQPPPPLTTNTIICALAWAAVTRARKRRDPALAAKTSRLVEAVNGRRRIGEAFSTPADPYLGNVVLYSMAEFATADADAAVLTGGDGGDDASAGQLAALCDAIYKAHAPARVGARHIAEVVSLVGRVEHYATVFPGWELFGARDLMVTSWAHLDLYGLDFGGVLGKPEFVRVRQVDMPADGLVMVLPKRMKTQMETTDSSSSPYEVLEVRLMLRKDDMAALEKDSTWKSLVE